jgi:hypothetical protein
MSRSPKEFRTVNRILGAQPNLGPIPGDQVIPWVIFMILAYVLGRNIFMLDYLQCFFLAAWMIATWWILTGRQAWRFLSKFISVPTVVRGVARYQSLFEEQIEAELYERQSQGKKTKRRRR